MQTSIPSLKKQFQCATFLKTIMLLVFLQLQVSSKILINTVENDYMYKFDLKSKSNVATDGRLNFLKGYWTLITNGILEFAPAEPTFLIFSTTDSSQFIYLEKDVRVLSFKIHPDDFWVQAGPSHKKTIREPKKSYTNFTQFYEPGFNGQVDIDRNMRFLLKIIKFDKSDQSQVQSLQERLEKVNVIPYYELKSKESVINFSNQIGYFLEDNGDSMLAWAKETNLIQANWQEMINEQNHNTFKRNFVARLMIAMYFQDYRLIAASGAFDDNLKINIKIHQMLLLDSALPKAQEIIDASEGLEEAFGKITDYLSKVSGRIVEYYYSRKRYPFFDDLFRPRNDKIQFPTESVNLDAILKQRSEWRTIPMDDYTYDSMELAYDAFMFDHSHISVDLLDLEEEAKQAFLAIVEKLFDSMAAVVPDLGNINPQEQPQFMQFFENEKFKAENSKNNCADAINNLINAIESNPLETKFDANDKETILNSIGEYRFSTIVRDMVRTFYVPFSMEEFENRVVRKLSDFPPVNNMGINFNSDNNAESVDVLQEMLYVVGILNYVPRNYYSKVKSDAPRDILKWVDGDRILLV
jgi:hypothetical protein